MIPADSPARWVLQVVLDFVLVDFEVFLGHVSELDYGWRTALAKPRRTVVCLSRELLRESRLQLRRTHLPDFSLGRLTDRSHACRGGWNVTLGELQILHSAAGLDLGRESSHGLAEHTVDEIGAFLSVRTQGEEQL